MAPLLKELSNLEVEPIQIVENVPASEEESSLYGIIAASENVEVESLVVGTLSIIPVALSSVGTNPGGGTAACCCCCCCPTCCCPIG